MVCCDTRKEAVMKFRKYVKRTMFYGWGQLLTEIKGRNLACWCPLNKPCHADVLLEMANK